MCTTGLPLSGKTIYAIKEHSASNCSSTDEKCQELWELPAVVCIQLSMWQLIATITVNLIAKIITTYIWIEEKKVSECVFPAKQQNTDWQLHYTDICCKDFRISNSSKTYYIQSNKEASLQLWKRIKDIHHMLFKTLTTASLSRSLSPMAEK